MIAESGLIRIEQALSSCLFPCDKRDESSRQCQNGSNRTSIIQVAGNCWISEHRSPRLLTEPLIGQESRQQN